MSDVVFLAISVRGSTALHPPSSIKWAEALFTKSIYQMRHLWLQRFYIPYFSKAKQMQFFFIFYCAGGISVYYTSPLSQSENQHQWTSCSILFHAEDGRCVMKKVFKMLQEYI